MSLTERQHDRADAHRRARDRVRIGQPTLERAHNARVGVVAERERFEPETELAAAFGHDGRKPFPCISRFVEEAEHGVVATIRQSDDRACGAEVDSYSHRHAPKSDTRTVPNGCKALSLRWGAMLAPIARTIYVPNE